MANREVGCLLAWFGWFWFQKVGTLAEMVIVQLLLKGLICGFGEHRLFLKDGENTHRLYREKKRTEECVRVRYISERLAFSKSSVTQIDINNNINNNFFLVKIDCVNFSITIAIIFLHQNS